MNSLSRESQAANIISSIRICDVYQALTGVEPRRTGRDTWRAPATWRGGNGLNVSGDDSRGVWHDFVDDSGGGVLDLVVQVRGGDRQAALRWVAELAGVPLSDEPLSPADRARWAEERRALEQELPAARYWRRAAAQMSDNLLDSLKSALFDATLPQPEVDEIGRVENMLAALRHKDGAPLVAEYRWWLEYHPGLAAAMVASAKRLERMQRRALLAYLHAMDTCKAAA